MSVYVCIKHSGGGSGDVYCVEPHQVGPHLHQQVVSLLR